MMKNHFMIKNVFKDQTGAASTDLSDSENKIWSNLLVEEAAQKGLKKPKKQMGKGHFFLVVFLIFLKIVLLSFIKHYFLCKMIV